MFKSFPPLPTAHLIDVFSEGTSAIQQGMLVQQLDCTLLHYPSWQCTPTIPTTQDQHFGWATSDESHYSDSLDHCSEVITQNMYTTI